MARSPFETMLARYQDRVRALSRAVEEARERAWLAVRRAWPLHVRRIATRARPAPTSQIVAEDGRLGWRAWGDEAGSRRRLDAARESFEPMRAEIVRREVSDHLRRSS